MKKTAALIEFSESVSTKYDGLVKEAQTGEFGTIVIDCAENIRSRMNDPRYQEEHVKHAMREAFKALISLTLQLTSGRKQPL